MRTLQIICLGFCLMSVVSAATGVSSIRADGEKTVVFRHDALGRVFALTLAAGFGAFAYGIQKRAMITWRLGLAALILLCVVTAYEIWRSTLGMPPGQRWVAVSAAISVTGIVSAFWISWWLRQKSFFR